MQILLNSAGGVVVAAAVLTTLIASWSLLPRPRRIFSRDNS